VKIFHATKPRQAEIPLIISGMKQLSNFSKGKCLLILPISSEHERLVKIVDIKGHNGGRKVILFKF
jgi:hypothetical protein